MENNPYNAPLTATLVEHDESPLQEVLEVLPVAAGVILGGALLIGAFCLPIYWIYG